MCCGALHRHQSSLEGVIDYSLRPSLSSARRTSANRRFYQLINHFDGDKGSNDKYDELKLVRYTYEFSISQESRDHFLCALFASTGIPILADDDIDLSDPTREAELRKSLVDFAKYLFENFFLPLNASTKKTPQPSPASHSAVMRTQGQGQAFAGTPERIATLRHACLIRGRYRASLTGEKFEDLEVAHILPHSLTRLNSSRELDPSKAAALSILNMFDCGAAYLIEGTEIDRPGNALTLTHNLHTLFGDFRIFFTPVDQQPHTAIAHILHLSAAGDYIDDILRDVEEPGAREDASTELEHLLRLGLSGWPIGQVLG
ncbi:HNHc domain-containing protein [Fusarium sp. Ph1]|nr:HNHc domain-containing protein [Fusarium sp. Ph1]